MTFEYPSQEFPAPAEPPTEEEALAQLRARKPSPEDALNQLKQRRAQTNFGIDPQFTLDGDFWDQAFASGPKGYLLNRFGQGVLKGFGAEPLGVSPETEKMLREQGVWNDYAKGQTSVLRTFNESLMRSTAIGVDSMFRGANAFLYGVGAVVPPVQAGLEAFPAGHLTGFPIALPPKVVGLLDDASELGILPREEARRSLSPTGEASATERVEGGPSIEISGMPAEPPDVHGLARTLEPETFQKYDALAQQKETFRQWIDILRDAKRLDPEAVKLQERIDSTLGKVKGVEERLTKRAAARLEADRAALDDFLTTDTEDMAKVRQDLMKTDFEMRELAPQVSDAYRRARDEILPPEEQVIPQAREPEAPALQPQVEEPTQIINLAQRRQSISAEVTRVLQEAGRPPEEARAGAALWQAYYDTRAQRLGIPSRQLFDEEAPNVRSGEGTQRGRFTFEPVRNTITLFKNADASTFVHESAHQWLDDLVKDARRSEAPADLVADMGTVREWLGATEERLTRLQHEKFARGFERYLMEGQAPSAKLASVFEKFKEWLSRIYQTVSKLRAPINDEIRGVYDRLLSRPRSEPVIAAEREGARTFAEDHEVAVRETPLDEAEAKAAEMRTERDQVAMRLSEEVDRVRRETRRGPQRIRVPEREGAGAGVAAPGEGAASPNEPVSTGRVAPAGESKARPDGSFEPADGELIDKAGNIRVENLNAPEDVTAAIHQAAADRGGFIEKRRGVLSDVQVTELADALGMDAKKLNRRKVGQAFNAEEIVAARKLLVESATKVRDAAAKAATGDPKAILAYGKERERLLMIQGQVSGITAEAGRALRAFRDLEGMADASTIAELFQKTIGTLGDLQKEARLVGELDSTQKVNKFLREKEEPTWKDMVIEAWLNSLLSGPFTHVVNIVGNTSVALGSIVETGAAGVVSKLRGSEAVRFAEVGDRVAGLLQGSTEGLIAAGRALWDEGVIEEAAHTVEQKRFRAIPSKVVNVGGIDWNVGGAQIRLPARFLTAEDEFFRAVAFRQEMNVLARTKAGLEGLEGDALNGRIADLLRNPTDDMISRAKDFAAYQTFTKSLGPLGRAVQNFANSHPAAKYVVPFVRTPVNLFKYATERTPLGFAMREVRENLSGVNGEAAKDTQIARMALGTMVMMAAGWMAFSGKLSGGGPADRNQQATLRRTGWQPYSIDIGGTVIPYTRFDPFSTILGVAADMAEAIKNGTAEDAELEKVAATLALNLGKNFVQKTSLRGVTSLVQAVVDPQRYGQTYLEAAFGSMVPSAIGQTARSIDPEMREVHGIVDAWKSRTPVWRESLFPRRDLAGEPINESLTGWTNEAGDPVWSEMARLQIGKAPPAKDIQGVTLTLSQYDELSRIGGQLGKKMADEVVSMPGYANLPDGMKRKVLSGVWDRAREVARAQIMMQSLNSDNDIVEKARELRMKALQ